MPATSFLGYFKYTGEAVASGYLDARTSAEALIGIDEVLRYFLYQENEALQEIEFEIPVKVQEGSWETLIPDTLGEWLMTALGAGATTYLTTALKKAAENDFKDKGIKDIVKEAFKAIKWVVKIAVHMKSLTVKQFTKAEFTIEGKREDVVSIKNDSGLPIYVPQVYLDTYAKCPDKLFSRLTKLIKEGRELEIDINPALPKDADDTEGAAVITTADKYVFTQKEDEEDIILPELVHQQYVELEGHITKGNEKANTIGLDYKRHILICIPANGNIISYKNLLFTNCTVKGYVDRTDDNGEVTEKKPKITFIDLTDTSKPDTQLGLFIK